MTKRVKAKVENGGGGAFSVDQKEKIFFLKRETKL
jgi:hypothetical protein